MSVSAEVSFSSAMIEQHRAHQKRLRRIADRAIVPTSVPLPLPCSKIPGERVTDRIGRISFISESAIHKTNALIRELRPISVAAIQSAVTKAYNLPRDKLLDRCRRVQNVRARHIAIYLAEQMTPHSLAEIGRRFGGMDHTTILHAVRKIKALIASDAIAAAEIAAVRTTIIGERLSP